MMRKLIILAFIISFSSYSQIKDSLELARINYIKTVNDTYYTTYGNNDVVYMKCRNKCTIAEMYLTDKFYKSMFVKSKKIKRSTAKNLAEGMNYVLLTRGFDSIIVRNESIIYYKKKLSLNRKE